MALRRADSRARPEFGQRWDRAGSTPIEWEINQGAFTLLGFTGAFTERSILRLRAHNFSGVIEDFEVAVRMCEYASKDPTSVGILVTIATILQCESAFWELVQDPSVDLKRISPAPPERRPAAKWRAGIKVGVPGTVGSSREMIRGWMPVRQSTTPV